MSDVTKIPGTDDSIVMTDVFERDVTGAEANLVRVDSEANVIWSASPPGAAPDFWTEYAINGDVVEAFSWSSFRVRLDISTGDELSRTLTTQHRTAVLGARSALVPVVASGATSGHYALVATDATVEVLGVHPVPGVESCHLIEMRIDGSDVAPDFALFTQPIRDRPSSDWQVAYDERLLDDEGDRVASVLPIHPAKIWPNPARVVFFFHFLDSTRPLATPFGDVTLPPPTDTPARLSFLTYGAP